MGAAPCRGTPHPAGPLVYLDEIRQELDFVYGVSVLVVTILQYSLAHMQISKKKSLPHNAAEWNEELWTLCELEPTQVNDPGLAEC